MDRVSVKMPELNLRASDSAKSGGQTKEVSDDFKKLLKDQTDEGSVPKDTKTDKSTEKPQDPKEEKEPVKEEKPQTEGLLAAYQMDLGMRPEMIQAEPVVEEAAPEIQIAGEMQLQVTEADTAAVEEMQAQPVQEAVVQLAEQKPEEKTETVRITETQEEQPEVSEPEARTETADIRKEPEEHAGEEAVQTDTRTAEAAVQPQTAEPVKVETQEVMPEAPVRMQVPQPEALPEKVTEQIMAKMSEGVQEFEIQIEPENLGKIAVKILYQEGQATVSILCSEKKTLDILGRSAGELGQVIEKNLGGTTTVIVEKPESDYLNQSRDENQQNGREAEQEQKQDKKEQNAEDPEQFLQKLRLGLAG